MAWSYRADRADEIYAPSGGPAVAQAEQIPRPPSDGQNASEVREKKPKSEADKKKELEVLEKVARTPEELVILRGQLQDPEAGPRVLTPSERLAQESERRRMS
jgi:hypothetical protein